MTVGQVKPDYQNSNVALYLGDCLEKMYAIEDGSVDLVLVDPPYRNVKKEKWDRQWKSDIEYLVWLDRVAAEWQRILKPNGSLYCFASSKMSARVEVMLGKRFNVLTCIRWVKEHGWHKKLNKTEMRQWANPQESIIFCEQSSGSEYGQACDELRGFVFEPLRAYLNNEKAKANFTTRQVAEAFQKKTGSRTVTGMAGHWFSNVQWVLPTLENYHWLQFLFNNGSNNKYLKREYEDLKREYEDLKREYEDLRRPFNLIPGVPYTDTWHFDTVRPYRDKHPCEKPQPLLEHIIKTSSNPGALIFDNFMGTGSAGITCVKLNRRFIGIEQDTKYFQLAKDRIIKAQSEPRQLELIQ